MEIKEITEKNTWDSYVLSHKPNTFLQSWEWGVVQERTGERISRIGFFKNNNLVGVAQIVTVQAKRGTFLLIPHGPIVPSDQYKDVLEALLTHTRAIAVQEGAVALRVAPLIEASEATESMFRQLGFRPAPIHIHAELTWVLDISLSPEDLLAGMRKTTRHAIRRAQKKGVQVEILTQASGLERFWPLYETTKDRHGFVPFSKSGLLEECLAFQDTDRLLISIASVDGKDVAGAIFIQYGETLFYHHGASLKLSSDTPAAQYLHWETMLAAKGRGVTQYNFWGIAPKEKKNHPFAGITTFKTGFGGYAIDYMHAQDVALSPKYALLWAVDRYRAWRRGF